MSDAEKVYRGYSAQELSVQYNPSATVSDLGAYQQWNAEQSKRVCASMRCERNVAYGEADIQKLDIFLPQSANAPVLIDIHGGGWTAGSKNARGFPAEAIVPKGVMWVPIDYGLAPNYKLDAIVDHVRSALTWIYKNIARYGGNPDNIYVSGNSAGGHLAGTFLIPGWQSNYGVPDNVVKGVCAMSGVYDMMAVRLSGSGSPNDALKMDDAEAKRNSPMLNLPQKSCPLIISYGAPELPEFKRQGIDFAKAWSAAGLSVTEIAVPGAHHFAMSREFANPDSELHQAMMTMMGI
jgi:arylformamidase